MRDRYRLRVVKGTFKSDYWLFDTIEKLDFFIHDTRHSPYGSAAGLVKPGTMVVEEASPKRKKWKEISTR